MERLIYRDVGIYNDYVMTVPTVRCEWIRRTYMAESFQKEIPKARVNITLDVETGGAKKKLELPMKLLVMGDFSNGKTQGRITERERININKNNFQSVMRSLASELDFNVENKLNEDGKDIRIQLKVDSIKSLDPEVVAEQIPELHKMLAMRNLLKDLRSNILDNGSLRRELEKIVKSRPELLELKERLDDLISDSDNPDFN
jgi:type VI secretion system protein ImpB